MEQLTPAQIQDADLQDWRHLWRALYTRFDTGSFARGLSLVAAIGEAAEAAGHHPDITLTYPSVAIRLTSHDSGGVTAKDVDLARRISTIAAADGVPASPAGTAQVDLALDTADQGEIDTFWSSVLTGSPDNVDGDEIADPAGQAPLMWFQRTDAHETPRQRFHLDVQIPADELDARVEAAVAAGGRRVEDLGRGRAFVVVEDAQGNRACFCTVLDR
ncbi:4a-hydroxytetrahydrobiopterin dehydratase [Georgenia sp. Z1491]|uniref:4a-hydroxytetrahydrobiopterin dehydratase n=1 Tax=Georgenia sp. Z1491 TaxID=3416707 RepID=UPI003CF6BEAA